MVSLTDVATSTACDKVIVNVKPLPSVAEAFSMLKTALSLLVIVPVAVPFAPEIVTLRPPALSPPSVAVKVSLSSTFASDVVLTVTVCIVVPAANVTTCPITAE